MWAMFSRTRGGEWKYRGMTEYEEIAVEFEESVEFSSKGRDTAKVVFLED